MDWCIPDHALRFNSLTRDMRPWMVRFVGGVLDGRHQVQHGGMTVVVPVLDRDSRLTTQEYRMHKVGDVELEGRLT